MQLAPRLTLRRDTARLTSALGAPAPVASALLLGVACYTSKTFAEGLALGVLLAVCATLPSTLYIEHMLLHGRLKQRHLAQSSQRMVPLAIGCASVLVAAMLVGTLAASRDVLTVLLTMLFVLGFSLAATPLIRVSVHVAAITGTILVLQLLFGTIALALLPVAALVGWSRLELSEHTPAQVLSGAVVGVVGASLANGVVG